MNKMKNMMAVLISLQLLAVNARAAIGPVPTPTTPVVDAMTPFETELAKANERLRIDKPAAVGKVVYVTVEVVKKKGKPDEYRTHFSLDPDGNDTITCHDMGGMYMCM
jgi:hypothetical protein